MPQATLTFQLPEEYYEYHQAVSAGRLFSDLCSVDNELRGWLKHGFPKDMTLESLAEHIRSELNETRNKVEL